MGRTSFISPALEKAVTSLVNAVMFLRGRGKGAGGLKVGGRKCSEQICIQSSVGD